MLRNFARLSLLFSMVALFLSSPSWGNPLSDITSEEDASGSPSASLAPIPFLPCLGNGALLPQANDVLNVLGLPDVVPIQHLSPNYNERKKEISMVIVHYTAMRNADEALKRLCSPDQQQEINGSIVYGRVSAHYLIADNGTLYQLVDDKYRAWHAGVSYWQGERDINSASLGIELDNPGGKPFSSPQMGMLIALLHDLSARYEIRPDLLLGHSDVAPARKQDPGELFPWDLLYWHGLGLWAAPPLVTHPQPCEALVLQEALANFGYECSSVGTWDPTSQAALIAFHRHYMPQHPLGVASLETLDHLRLLMALNGTLADSSRTVSRYTAYAPSSSS